MINLYKLNASDSIALFGTPDERKNPKLQIIGQKTDDSEFLILASEDFGILELQNTIPNGFVFTFCQAWGLTIDDEVIRRVKQACRAQELTKIKAQVLTTAGETVILDGDVIRPENDRPASAILISNAYSIMPDGGTIEWFDSLNKKRVLPKESMLAAIQQIAFQTNYIWMEYA